MRAPWELRSRAGPPWIATFIRAVLLSFCAVLALLGRGEGARVLWLAALATIGTVAIALPQRVGWSRFLALAEAGVAATAAALTGGADSPLLAYLPAAMFAAGLGLGVPGALISAGSAGAAALAARLAEISPRTAMEQYSTAAAEWTVIALTLGLCGAWVRSLDRTSATVSERYDEAYRLLDQLRAVTRSLPGSLDPGTAADALLDRVQPLAPLVRSAVLLHSGDQFIPLAVHGARRVPWRPAVDEPGPVSTAWRTRQAVVDRRPPDLGGRRRGSSLLTLPLLAGDRAIGLLIVESTDLTAFDGQVIESITRTAIEATPAIETAALFDELRMSAATEERTRLAREMHDGIAQDLAYLGYQVDALTRSIETEHTADAVALCRELRSEMSRLTADLRLSISDLRSSIGPARSVGAALTEYARSAGAGAGITVHVSLAEQSIRLAADIEVGLLRISHEAITAARRRTGTRNLWVRLAADPPSYDLDVSDDGETIAGKPDVNARSAEIMKEIASRIGGVLEIGPRRDGGTSVHVQQEGGAGEPARRPVR